jgi:hypothetical protein
MKLKVSIEVGTDNKQEVFETMQEYFAESFEHWNTLPTHGDDLDMTVEMMYADDYEEPDKFPNFQVRSTATGRNASSDMRDHCELDNESSAVNRCPHGMFYGACDCCG